MRDRLVAAALMALSLLAFTPGAATALQAPNFDLAAPVGAPWRGRVRLRDERGKAVVLVFWAASCRNCHADLVQLDRVYRRLRARGVLVVGIATDDARATPALVPTIRRLGLSFPIVADPGGRTCVRYDPLRAFPLAVVVGRRGELLRSVELRSRARAAELERYVAELVGAPVEPEEDDADDDARTREEDDERATPSRRREREDADRDDDRSRDEPDAAEVPDDDGDSDDDDAADDRADDGAASDSDDEDDDADDAEDGADR